LNRNIEKLENIIIPKQVESILCIVLLLNVPGPAVVVSTLILVLAFAARTALRAVAKPK
jgi:hypothetical protein